MNLGLGTVQFGQDYGISNQYGQTSIKEAGKILHLASTAGITLFDTAPGYGSSEEVLGQLLASYQHHRIVTKVPPITNTKNHLDEATAVKESFLSSLSRLKVESVYGLLLHDAQDLLGPKREKIFETLLSIKDCGKVQKIGVSVYNPNQIEEIVSQFPVDLIQLPVNLFDQRSIHSGCLKNLKSLGIEIHARSIFLQGLLLMDPLTLPSYFNPVRNHLINYHRKREACGFSMLEAALSFVQGIPEIDIALCGTNTLNQLKEILAVKETFFSPTPEEFRFSDESIIDPSRWKK